VGYIKRIEDGSLLYLEEVRTGRRSLAMTSMRKYPGTTDFDTITKSVLPSNARSDTGDVRIINPDGSPCQDSIRGESALLRYVRQAREGIPPSLRWPVVTDVPAVAQDAARRETFVDRYLRGL